MYVHGVRVHEEILMKDDGSRCVVYKLFATEYDPETGDWTSVTLQSPMRAGQGRTPEAARESLRQTLCAYYRYVLRKGVEEALKGEWNHLLPISNEAAERKIREWFASAGEAYMVVVDVNLANVK